MSSLGPAAASIAPNLKARPPESAQILIVDDEPDNLAMLEDILHQAGYGNTITTSDSSEVVALCASTTPDLVLLDLHVQEPDGFEIMEKLESTGISDWVQVLVLTADMTSETRGRALRNGARDFITKPFDRTEILLRIRNLLEMQMLHMRLRGYNDSLEKEVFERTQDLNDARLEILQRLALAAEYRDDETGEHTQRVGRACGAIARELELGEDETDLLEQGAPLHDIGKIGIPDLILLKPGPLTKKEFALIKTHVEIGCAILSGSSSPLLNIANQIAATHHEWFDGSGYPNGIAGMEIPLLGRITAVADVFDALTHKRPYKPAWPVDQALAELKTLRGHSFDPRVHDAFLELDHEALLAPVESRV